MRDRYFPRQAFVAPVRGQQIPIALAEPGTLASRAFRLPWRLSKTGPRASGNINASRHPRCVTASGMPIALTTAGPLSLGPPICEGPSIASTVPSIKFVIVTNTTFCFRDFRIGIKTSEFLRPSIEGKNPRPRQLSWRVPLKLGQREGVEDGP